MKALPKFETFENDRPETGCFIWDPPDESIEDLYMEAEDQYYELENSKAKKLLQKIIRENPLFHEAFILLCSIHASEDKYDEAVNELEKAIRIWESAIPENYDGQILWGFLENRPYLSLLFELADLYDFMGETDKSIKLSESILAYNPDDNQGVRWTLGNLYLKSNQSEKAEKYLKKTAGEYPPNRYSYALFLWLNKKRWDAITQFRLAFIDNIYIFEYLTFKAPLIPYDIFETTNLHGIQGAVEYLNKMGPFWMQHQEALGFMEILKSHPVVISELNDIYSLKHELNILPNDIPFEEEDDFDVIDEGIDMDTDFMHDTRKELFEEIESIKKQVTVTSSKKILKELDEFIQ